MTTEQGMALIPMDYHLFIASISSTLTKETCPIRRLTAVPSCAWWRSRFPARLPIGWSGERSRVLWWSSAAWIRPRGIAWTTSQTPSPRCTFTYTPRACKCPRNPANFEHRAAQDENRLSFEHKSKSFKPLCAFYAMKPCLWIVWSTMTFQPVILTTWPSKRVK